MEGRMKRSGGRENNHNFSRRDFLKYLSWTAASAGVLGACNTAKSADNNNTEPPKEKILAPRTKAANVFVNAAGKPLLVCVTGTDFKQMLIAGLAQIGGLSKLINSAQDVLIKPNCNAAEPYPGITDVNSLVSIIKEVKKVTSGTVSVGDQGYEASPAVYSFSGMDIQVGQAGAALITLAQTYSVKREGWSESAPNFKVYSHIYDAPVIINACVLKRHHTADYTCAIKNNVGTVAGPSLTSTRDYLHRESDEFERTVAEIAGMVNPELTIVDARTILTVAGPSYSSGVLVDANKVILCGDMVATDTYCQQILAAHDISFSPSQLITGRAENLGLGTTNLSQVEIVEISV